MNIDHEIEIERLREQVEALRMTVAQLRAQLGEDPTGATSWLQRKVVAQAKALARRDQRIVNQRFVLRSLERLGRGLTPDELATARLLEGVTVPA